MNLLRYYFMVGGEKFDAKSFAIAATKNGLVGGLTRNISNIKKLRRLSGERIEVQILSGVSGTSGSGFTTWQTELMDYALDRDAYLANKKLGMTTAAAQLWLREEEVIVKFLTEVKARLPSVAAFCASEFFLLLKLIYGYDEADSPGICNCNFSEVLINSLSDLNAGLSTDTEPFELHFSRLSALRKNR